MAGYDPCRIDEVLAWPMAEGLVAFEHMQREQARADYEFELLVWTVLAQSGATKKKAPEPPALLKE